MGKKNQLSTAFSAIEVLLKNRSDLLSNLVKMVQRYMQYKAGGVAMIGSSVKIEVCAPNDCVDQTENDAYEEEASGDETLWSGDGENK